MPNKQFVIPQSSAGEGVGSGSVTSVTFTGDGTVLTATPSAAVTTSGTVTATLKNGSTGTNAVVLSDSPFFTTQILSPKIYLQNSGSILTSVLGNSGGSGYTGGDTGTIDAGDNLATFVVDTVDGNGAVVTYHLSSTGLGYPVQTNIATTTSGGGDDLFTISVNSITVNGPNLTQSGSRNVFATFPVLGNGNTSGLSFIEGSNTGLQLLIDNSSLLTATITNIALTSNVLTVTCSNTFGGGTVGAYSASGKGFAISLSGLTTSTFLNGQIVEILTVSGSQFTAAFTHANVGSHADTGTATYQVNASALNSGEGPLFLTGQTGNIGGIFTDPSYPSTMIGFGSGTQSIQNIADTWYGLSIGWDIGGLSDSSGGNWTPSSGNGNFTAVTIQPRIGQTGSASGSYKILEVVALEAGVLGTGNLLIDCMTGSSHSALTSQFNVTNNGQVVAKRFSANLGTAVENTDFSASGGWGTSPVITIVGGTDAAASLTIQAKATTGASPTLTFTFEDGTWTNTPIVIATRTDTVAATAAPGATVTNQWAVTSVSATQVVFTFNGQPVANSTYGLAFVCIGT